MSSYVTITGAWHCYFGMLVGRTIYFVKCEYG